MAEPKRGSVEAFKAAEKRRKERVASKKGSLFGKAGSQLPKKVKEKREAFNKKVRAINEKARANNPTIAKFKKAEERRQIRLAKVNKMNPNSPKAKRIAKQIKATADVEKDLPKSKINTATKIGTAVGAASSTIAKQTRGQELGAAAKKPIQGKDKPNTKADLSSFGEAFKKARARGVGTKFAYNDKMYSAVTRDDISKAGASSLKEFLNESKRKSTTKIAKAPGQITDRNRGQLKRGGVINRQQGGMSNLSREDLKRMAEQLRQRKGQMPSTPMPKPRPKRAPKDMMEDEAPRFRRPIGKPELRARPRRLLERRKRQAEKAQKLNRLLKDRSGAAVSDREMKSLMEQMGKAPVQDRMKTGGSVMARGGRMGRSKPTKMY